MIRNIIKINVVLIVAFSIFIQIGCSTDPETSTSSALSHTQQGWDAYNSGEFSLALLSFERALNIDPEFADAHNGVGWTQMSLILNLSLAQEAFQNAIRFDTSNADAWVGLANVLYLRYKDSSDFDAAIRAIDNALQADSTYLFRHDYYSDAELYSLKAACYFYLGEKHLAIEEVNKALQIDKNNKNSLLIQNLLND